MEDTAAGCEPVFELNGVGIMAVRYIDPVLEDPIQRSFYRLWYSGELLFDAVNSNGVEDGRIVK